MNIENVRKVIAALRSGKYRQGRGTLRSQDKFCCLGVACDVSELGVWNRDDGANVYEAPNSRSYTALPQDVQDWLGFDDCLGPAVYSYITSAEANDAYIPFENIADEWEKLLEKED